MTMPRGFAVTLKRKCLLMNLKIQIRTLERQIAQKKKELKKLEALEAKSRQKWTKENRNFREAATQLARLKVFHTRKHELLKRRVDSDWPTRSVELTKQRDALRQQIAEVTQSLQKLVLELATFEERESSNAGATDEIVTQVFSLNDVVVSASKNREDFLTRHVFTRLFDEKGKLRSQVSFTSLNGLRRVVAMVNSITIIQGDMADEAMRLIERFFDRFQKVSPMDEVSKALYDLTRQLLIEKTSFKVGPDLYRFLGMELDPKIFPELAAAQRLLRQSIRSEKTNSYIRIYERASMKDKWQVVRQS